MKTILTLLLSLLTLLSLSNDTTHVSKTFKNDNSKINIEFLSFEDSLGNMVTRVKSPIESDSIFLISGNSFNKLRNGVTLIDKDGVGFISQFHLKHSDISSIKSITIYIDGKLFFFEDGGRVSNPEIDNVYFKPNLQPIQLTAGDLLIQAGREKNIAFGFYALSVISTFLLVESPDQLPLVIFPSVIGLGFNISGNIKISKAGKLMNKK